MHHPRVTDPCVNLVLLIHPDPCVNLELPTATYRFPQQALKEPTPTKFSFKAQNPNFGPKEPVRVLCTRKGLIILFFPLPTSHFVPHRPIRAQYEAEGGGYFFHFVPNLATSRCMTRPLTNTMIHRGWGVWGEGRYLQQHTACHNRP